MNGIERFGYYLTQVEELLAKSETEENPGWWLYTNDLRTRIFMLEALAKLYSKLHNKTIFEKLQERFKEIEDVLGDINYYDEYENKYKNNPGVSGEILTYFRQKKVKHIQLFNEILSDNKWIKHESLRVKKIRKKLTDVQWLKEDEEMLAIKQYYYKAIESIKEFYFSGPAQFTDMEDQVHELRRKLRWLSIYPQALRGSIQLSVKVLPEPTIEKYLVPEIINSPFNKLPDPTGFHHLLLLEKNYFLALSWLIAELGKLKDAGLGNLVLQEAIKHTALKNQENSPTYVLQNQPPLEDLLKTASAITKDFFAEGNLDKLVDELVEV